MALSISLPTLLGVAPLLGLAQEDRAIIRNTQDPGLMGTFTAASARRLRSPELRSRFCVAPLDILVTSDEVLGKRFHFIELNGSGIGGLTNLPEPIIEAVLKSLEELPARLPPALLESPPVVLVGFSGKESTHDHRLNKLLYEKILYAEALRRGFNAIGRWRSAEVSCLDEVAARTLSGRWPVDAPAIVLGYIKDFLRSLDLHETRATLHGVAVAAAINDRLCLNLLRRYGGQLDLAKFVAVNHCFWAGADKGVAYTLLNAFMEEHASEHRRFPQRYVFSHAHGRDELIHEVLRRVVREGERIVIKPQGTGHGDGIEFFLERHAREQEIIERIDHSIHLTEAFYDVKGGAFPYTICEYIDACTLPNPSHPLFGHKFELRVVVYRDGDFLCACPSIVKIASQRFDASCVQQSMLINNITASSRETLLPGYHFTLPLCRRETLHELGISEKQIVEVCCFCTAYVEYVLDHVDALELRALVGEPRPLWAPMLGDPAKVLAQSA